MHSQLRSPSTIGRVLLSMLLAACCALPLYGQQRKPQAKAPKAPSAEELQWSVYAEQKVPDQASALRFNIDACVAFSQSRKTPSSKQEWDSQRANLENTRNGPRPGPPPAKHPSMPVSPAGRARRIHGGKRSLQSQPKFYHGQRLCPKMRATAARRRGHRRPCDARRKNSTTYQTAQIGFVRQVLGAGPDPIGQGERRLPATPPGRLPGVSDRHDQRGSHYLGHDPRLDYVLTRPDVDPKRVGLAGNSGGGENTFYTMPLEPRFAAAASCCFVCSYEAWIKDGGNHCICNHMPGICRDLEQFEIIGLCAPRPLMACNGSKDPIFPIEGARSTIERAKQVYGLHGAADRVALAEAPLPHGWAQPLREAACGWMARWLKGEGDGSPIPESEFKPEEWNAPDLQCLKDGQMPADAKTYIDLIREKAQQELLPAILPVPAEKAAQATWATSLRQRLWDTLGGKPAGCEPQAHQLGSFDWENNRVERLAIQTEPNLEVPALFIRPQAATGPTPV